MIKYILFLYFSEHELQLREPGALHPEPPDLHHVVELAPGLLRDVELLNNLAVQPEVVEGGRLARNLEEICPDVLLKVLVDELLHVGVAVQLAGPAGNDLGASGKRWSRRGKSRLRNLACMET